MCPFRPVGLWYELHQVLLDLLRCLLRGQTEPIGQSIHVCIDDDALVNTKGIAQDDVGGLSTDPWQSAQLIHSCRYFTLMIILQGLTKTFE